DPDRLVRAIERLGELQAVAVAHDLAQLLTFRQTFYWEKNPKISEGNYTSPLSRYPAAGALFMIGKASLPALIKVIEMEKSGSFASENALYTIGQLFRDAPPEGVEYLTEAAAAASSPQAANRISKAAEKARQSWRQ